MIGIGMMVTGVPFRIWKSQISKEERSQMVFERDHKKDQPTDRLLATGSFENSIDWGRHGWPIGILNSMNDLL